MLLYYSLAVVVNVPIVRNRRLILLYNSLTEVVNVEQLELETEFYFQSVKNVFSSLGNRYLRARYTIRMQKRQLTLSILDQNKIAQSY